MTRTVLQLRKVLDLVQGQPLSHPGVVVADTMHYVEACDTFTI